MAFDTYSDLQAEITSFLHRDDLASQIPSFIRLAEADMQVRAKLSQWDAEATVAMTDGAGALPSDIAHIQSVIKPSSHTLLFLPNAKFDNADALMEAGEPEWFTVRGTSLYVNPQYTGDLTLRYTARFTPLSTAAPTNSLLTLFPDAYLNGSLMHAANWTLDDAALQKHAALFEANIRRIRIYMLDMKFPDGLQMRAA